MYTSRLSLYWYAEGALFQRQHVKESWMRCMQERRSWASVMRLPSFSSPSAERTSSATLGEATAAARSSFHSDDGERPSLLRRSSTDSSRDPCEQHADCLGGGAEGISSLYTSTTLRPRKLAGAAAAEASFDLDHVYNNWPSA